VQNRGRDIREKFTFNILAEEFRNASLSSSIFCLPTKSSS